MSVLVSTLVWERSKHKGSALLVLLAIADNAHDDGEAWPAFEYIARKTRLGRSAVKDNVHKLVVSGELLRTRTGTGRIPSLYAVNLEKLRGSESTPLVAAAAAASTAPAENRGGVPEPPQGGSVDPPNHQGTVNSQNDEERGLRPPKKLKPHERVWAHYVEAMKPRSTQLDRETAKVLRDALSVATGEECCRAIDGCARSDWHMGRDPKTQGRRYNSVSQIFRARRATPRGAALTARERIDFFIDLADQQEAKGGGRLNEREVSLNKQYVLDAIAYPDTEDVGERGREAAEWLREHAGIEWDVERTAWVPV